MIELVKDNTTSGGSIQSFPQTTSRIERVRHRQRGIPNQIYPQQDSTKFK
jgi:hypothetical protein